MGWSCSKAASEVMDSWVAACRETMGSSNTYINTLGQECFFEMSRIEHDDGAITGEVYIDTGWSARYAGEFRINGDGSVAQYPAHWPFAKNKGPKHWEGDHGEVSTSGS